MKQLINILLCALLFVPMTLRAQNTMEKAIERQQLILQKDSNNLKALKEVGMYYLKKSDFDNGIRYGVRLQKLAYKSYHPYYVICSHIILGQGYTMKGDRNPAYNNLQQAKANAESLKNDTLLCSVYNGLGLYEANLTKNYHQAITLFYTGLELARKMDNVPMKSLFLANLSVVYYLKKDIAGLPYAEECYEYGHEWKDTHLMRVGSETLAQMHYLAQNYAKALNYIQETEFLVVQNGFHDQADVYGLYGNILSGMNRDYEAIGCFRKAFLYASTSNTSSVVKAYTGYVNTLMKLKRYDEAARLLREGEDYIRINDATVEENSFYQTASRLYEQQGQYEKALHYHKMYQLESDSLFNIIKEHAISDLKVKYGYIQLENEHNKAQLDLVEREKKIQLLGACLILFLFIVFLLFCLYYRKHRLYQVIVRLNQQAIQREKELLEQIDTLEVKLKNTPPHSGKYVGSSLSDEKGNDIYNRLEQLMDDEHIYTDNLLTKEKVSEMLGTNRTYLSQIINEHTGKTFTQYINEYRAREAVRRLSDSHEKAPLKALSSELGFNSMTTFNNYFQAETGMTPAQYRDSVRHLEKK